MNEKSVLSIDHQWMVAQAYCNVADHEMRQMSELYSEKNRPFHHLRPRLFIDGDKWCALYGENLQCGVAGFGESPAKAADAFDVAFYAKLPAKNGVSHEQT